TPRTFLVEIQICFWRILSTWKFEERWDSLHLREDGTKLLQRSWRDREKSSLKRHPLNEKGMMLVVSLLLLRGAKKKRQERPQRNSSLDTSIYPEALFSVLQCREIDTIRGEQLKEDHLQGHRPDIVEGRSSIEREALADANDRLSELQSQFTHQPTSSRLRRERKKATEKADKARGSNKGEDRRRGDGAEDPPAGLRDSLSGG
ncbi:hypothetical protein HAX54_015407, partial [Datura stramonium]|nr:hypothetical protein [Datura stramonium]